jgi:hypothetical protein
MKLRYSILIAAILMTALFGCSLGVDRDQDITAPVTLQAAAENDPITVPEAGGPAAKWSEYTHRSISSIAASQWGLSAGRAANISEASDDPDTYQSGIDNGYNQQWSHAYIYDRWFSTSFYLWGDADQDFHDNIAGPQGGEGYGGLFAGYFYGSNQYQGDRYLGYALHFIEDVSITVHSTAPTSTGITVPFSTVDMLTHHFDFESWVNNNMNAGYNLLDAVANDYYYYPVTDLAQSLKNAAWASCAYKGTSSMGYAAWKAFRSAGYPTGTGTGGSTLAENVKKMLVSAGRYAKGAVKYTMDAYGQWGSEY